MSRRVLTLSLLVLAGCPEPTNSCSVDGDCMSGARCVDKVCVAGTGGGTAGGSSGGTSGGGTSGGMAGGTAGGGSTAGGSAGGMTGGGVAPMCSVACAPWAFCNGGADGGPRCEDGRLVVDLPVTGSLYDAGDDVAVLARLLSADGGVTSAMIPVVTSWGERADATSGTQLLVRGPPAAGQGSVTVGWLDGGLSQVRDVAFQSCATNRCAGFQGCRATVDGGECFDLPLTVSVASPATDGLYFNSPGIVLQVRVRSADGGQLPPSVPVTGTGATTMLASRDTMPVNADTYSVQVNFGADGPKTYVAGWPDAGASASATRTLVSDATPPTVTVAVLGAPTRQPHEVDPGSSGNPWKKDEEALVTVTVTDVLSPVEPVTLAMLRGSGDGGVAAAPGQCAGCTSGAPGALTSCSCFRADLAKTPLAGARGPTTVAVVGAQDRAQNASALAVSPAFDVTRFKWERTASAGLTPSVARSVAITDGGVVIVAATDPNNSRVTALSPSGAVLWEVSDAGVITAGPAVGASVWVATQSGTNVSMSSLSPATGVLQVRRCVQTGPAFEGDIALTQATQGGTLYEAPMGMLVGTNNLVVCTPTSNPRATIAGGPPLVVARPGTGQNVEVFINRGGMTDLLKYTFTGAMWVGNSGINLTSANVSSLAGLFLGPRFVGGGGGLPNNGVVVYAGNDAGVDLISMPSKAPTAIPTMDEPYSPVSVSAGHVYGGNASGALRRFPLLSGSVGGVAEQVLNLGDISKTTPVLGKGGRVYVVSASGSVSEVAWGVSSGPRWSYANLFGAGASQGQPALDVARDGTGAPQCDRGLGVFYVPSVSTGVARVTAIIVDSPGLDPLAPWPKYQRDNRNSGFADATSPAACP